MWRAIPLAKILLRMAAFGAVLGAALGLLLIIAFESTLPETESIYPQIILSYAVHGLILGGLVGVAMALYAAVAHRSIHKPAHFRFAMLIVATIVSLAVVQQPFHIVFFAELGTASWLNWVIRYADPGMIAMLVGTIAKHVAIGMMSLFVAGKYLREASAQYMKSPGQTPT